MSNNNDDTAFHTPIDLTPQVRKVRRLVDEALEELSNIEDDLMPSLMRSDYGSSVIATYEQSVDQLGHVRATLKRLLHVQLKSQMPGSWNK